MPFRIEQAQETGLPSRSRPSTASGQCEQGGDATARLAGTNAGQSLRDPKLRLLRSSLTTSATAPRATRSSRADRLGSEAINAPRLGSPVRNASSRWKHHAYPGMHEFGRGNQIRRCQVRLIPAGSVARRIHLGHHRMHARLLQHQAGTLAARADGDATRQEELQAGEGRPCRAGASGSGGLAAVTGLG